jgi:glycosyltransferase involved in cell wall biosynthesis
LERPVPKVEIEEIETAPAARRADNGQHVLGVLYVAVDVIVPNFTGSSTHVLEVGKNLRESGAAVFVLSRRQSSRQPRTENINGLSIQRVYRGIVCPLPSSKRSGGSSGADAQTTPRSLIYRLYLSTVLALVGGLLASRIVKKHKLDVVIERETSFGAGAVASIITGRPLVLEVNGPRFSPISARRASKITAYTMSGIGQEFTEKTRILDAGVNPEVFKPDSNARAVVRNKYGLGDSHVVCYVGTFQKWHGMDDVVRASRTVLDSFPNAKFLMVGPRYEETRRQAEELGVSHAFVFVGPVPYASVADYVNAADIMVSPANPSMSEWTRKHGLPEQFKIFEYMACRKPVIVTASGPMQRIVKDGKTGLTVPPGDFDALAKAICRLVREPNLADALASEGYSTVVEHFTWSMHAREIHQTILSAISDWSASRMGAS